MHWSFLHTKSHATVPAPVAAMLGIMGLLAGASQLTLAPSDLGQTSWAECVGISSQNLSQGQLWRLCLFPMLHSGTLHWILGLAGIYIAARSVEPIIGSGHLLLVLAAGNTAGALAHCMAGSLGWTESAQPVIGSWPILFTLAGVYGTVLPGWRLGSAALWGGRRLKWFSASAHAPTARTTACTCAIAGVLWWMSGWFPEGGPTAVLGSLAAGWAYTKALGFGAPFFQQQTADSKDLLDHRMDQMDWEEFLNTELNPVLEKISRFGLRSLTPQERRILRKSRRKLEGW